jgi:formate-dependent nitrite reductase membrane component NrfD
MAGMGGGLFLFSFILDCMGMYGPMAMIGALLGPVLVLIGTVFLLFDLGSVFKVYRLFSSTSTFATSWMVRGTWILTAFVIFALAYSLPSFTLFEWLPWGRASTLRQGIGVIAALLSILVVVYPGFLLGVLKSIPLWNTPALPLLFFLSGLDNGIAALLAVALLFPGSFATYGFHLLGAGDVVLIGLLLIVLGAYIEIVRQAGETAAASIRLLRTPLFIGGVLFAGLLIPLGLLVYSFFVTHATALPVLGGITSILLLAGGLLLRYSIIRAGIHTAVR